MRWGGLRGKLIALIVLALLPFVWVVSNEAHEQRLQEQQNLKEDALSVARLVRLNRLQLLESIRTMLMTLAHTREVQEPWRHDCAALMAQLRESNPTLLNVGACDASGEAVCSAMPLSLNLAGESAVTRAHAIGDMGVEVMAGDGPTLLFAYPVKGKDGDGRTVFATLDLLQVNWLHNTESKLPDQAVISIIGADGRTLFHSHEPEKNVGRPAGKEGVIHAVPQGEQEGYFVVDREGRSYVSVVERLGPLHDGTVFYVNVEVDLAAVDAAVARRWREGLGMIALVGALASGAAWVLGSRWVVTPARRLVETAREVSHGNLEVRTSLAGTSGEFGEIGAAFNQMTDRLSRRIGDLDRARRELQSIREGLEERVIERTAELERSRARLVDAIENIDAGFAMFDANGVMQAHNRLYREAFGQEAAPLVRKGRSYQELLQFFIDKGGTINGEKPTEAWLEERRRYFLEAKGGPVEERLPHSWVRLSIHRMRDGGRVVLLTDITTLKEAQEGLLLRNRAIAALNNGVLVTDPHQPDNPVVDCNPAFERISGYTKAEVVGHNCRFLQGPLSDRGVVERLREAIAAQREIQVVLRNYRKDGSLFWNELKISPVRDEQGRLIHFVGVVTDVTDREEAAAALKQAAEELQRSNRELEEFAYVASHDLQEPLRMVASYTQLLARRYRDKLDHDAQDFIDHAVNGAKRMQAFIEDLLKYSRVGTLKRPFEEVDLARLVADGLENFRLTMDEIGGQVQLGSLPTVYGDQGQLWQLFQNLISNAIKFRSDERPLRVEITSVPENGGWEIIVRDNGIGFNQKDATRIFEIFQRLHMQKSKGTGMGLVICKKIVERHGGRIWAEGLEGVGSVFHFTLHTSPPAVGT